MTDIIAEIKKREDEIGRASSMPLSQLIIFVNELGFRIIQLSQSGAADSKKLDFTCMLGSDQGAVYQARKSLNAQAALVEALHASVSWINSATPKMLGHNGQGYRHLLEAEPEREQVQRPLVKENPAPPVPIRERVRQPPAQPTPEHEPVQRPAEAPVVRRRSAPPVEVQVVRQRVRA